MHLSAACAKQYNTCRGGSLIIAQASCMLTVFQNITFASLAPVCTFSSKKLSRVHAPHSAWHTQPFRQIQVQKLTVGSHVQVTLMTTQQHLWSNLRGGAPSAPVWCPLQPTGILMTPSISSAMALGGLSCTPPTSFLRPGGQLSALDLWLQMMRPTDEHLCCTWTSCSKARWAAKCTGLVRLATACVPSGEVNSTFAAL